MAKKKEIKTKELNCTVNLYGLEVEKYDEIKKHMEQNRDGIFCSDNDVMERLVAIGMLYYEQHEKRK